MVGRAALLLLLLTPPRLPGYSYYPTPPRTNLLLHRPTSNMARPASYMARYYYPVSRQGYTHGWTEDMTVEEEEKEEEEEMRGCGRVCAGPGTDCCTTLPSSYPGPAPRPPATRTYTHYTRPERVMGDPALPPRTPRQDRSPPSDPATAPANRTGRIFSIFSLVRFQNTVCTPSLPTYTGTCYLAIECAEKVAFQDVAAAMISSLRCYAFPRSIISQLN